MACSSYIYNPHLHLHPLYQDQHSANETICRNPRHTVPNLLHALKKKNEEIIFRICKYHANVTYYSTDLNLLAPEFHI